MSRHSPSNLVMLALEIFLAQLPYHLRSESRNQIHDEQTKVRCRALINF